MLDDPIKIHLIEEVLRVDLNFEFSIYLRFTSVDKSSCPIIIT